MISQPITEKMDGQIQRWQDLADDRIHFLACYRLMTGNMLAAIAAGEFHDGIWVSELLHRFAGYYFSALDAYEAGDEGTPPVWSLAHEVACHRKGHVLENLFLGINAHINYDLVLTLVDMLGEEWPRLNEAQRQHRFADHCLVNEIIGRTIDSVQDGVVEPQLPAMAWVDILLGRVDEWALSQLIARWRSEVWRRAVSLLESDSPQERDQIIADVAAATMRRADAILAADSLAAVAELL